MKKMKMRVLLVSVRAMVMVVMRMDVVALMAADGTHSPPLRWDYHSRRYYNS